MAIEDQVVELKLKQKEVERAIREHDERFEVIEKLVEEQNEFLGAINVTLNKLQASFATVMSSVDKWAQRLLGAGAMALAGWVLLADAPLEKIKWILRLFT